MERDWLKESEIFLREHVAPGANAIDSDVEALREALRGMCDRGYMAMRRPAEYGGPALDEMSFRNFQESVARVSGSLAFLQTQHQSAVSMIAKGDNEELKERLLPKMGNGEFLCGIGFSQLRRSGPPMLKAERVDGGYELNGVVPWVTGHGFYHSFLIGAALPDGRSVFGVVPFSDTKLESGEIRFDGPMRLAAMESPQTMKAELTSWNLADEDVAFVKPDGWIQGNDMINVTLQAWFALGCARAGLDIMEEAFEKKQLRFINEAWQALGQELEDCRMRASEQDAPVEERLRTRAWAIDLAARCSHAGVVCSSGAANSIHHDAQRVYREALVYTVSAQTKDIMEASLARIVARGGLS